MVRYALMNGLTLAVAFTLAIPAASRAQQFRSTPLAPAPIGPLQNNYNLGSNPNFTYNPFTGYNLGANSSLAGVPANGIQRSTSSLANPLNFMQYGQITGTGPSTGTVATYNQFGLLGMLSNPYSSVGSGATQGSSPPPGVMLSVNYAQMFLPNQSTINNGGNPYGPYYGYGYPGAYNPYGPGYPGAFNPYYGYPGPFGVGNPASTPPGKGFFGNGGDGI
jgi:hypothetical protein